MSTIADQLAAALIRADTFITNGIALGFIRMPDADCPDPAHDTPQIVREALAAYRQSTTPAQAPAQAAEPVGAQRVIGEAYMALYGNTTLVTANKITARAYMGSENSSWLCLRFNTEDDSLRAHRALRMLSEAALHPAAPHPSEPATTGRAGLTGEQVVALFVELNAPCIKAETPTEMFTIIVRAVEAAHNIPAPTGSAAPTGG